MAIGDPPKPHIGEVYPSISTPCNLDDRFITALATDVKVITDLLQGVMDRLEAVEELYRLFSGSEVGDKEPRDEVR